MGVVSNTTVISNFASCGQLEALRRLFGEIYISLEVYQEIRAGLDEGYDFYAGIDGVCRPPARDGWIRLISLSGDEEVGTFSGLPTSLHAGEASCLAIAFHREWLFLSDDRTARKAARDRGVLVSGTLGCLARGVEGDLWPLEKANAWLARMIASGFHSPLSDLSDLLRDR